MGCEYIKNLILTDYTDATLNSLQKQAVEDHTSQCGSCKIWAKNSIEITMIKSKERAPEALWSRLEAVLDVRESKRVKGWDVSAVLAGLRDMLFLRPAMGFAVILLLTVTAYNVNTREPISMITQPTARVTVQENYEALWNTDLGVEEESLGSAMEMLFV